MNRRQYLRYLKTDVWKSIRDAKLLGSHFQCAKCGNVVNLQVHHKTYARIGCELLSDLEVLCDFCHKKIHKIIKNKEHFISKYKTNPLFHRNDTAKNILNKKIKQKTNNLREEMWNDLKVGNIERIKTTNINKKIKKALKKSRQKEINQILKRKCLFDCREKTASFHC